MNINNYICGYNFLIKSDYVIDINKCDDLTKINKNCIVYCKTDYIEKCFTMLQHCKYKVILITHASDYQISEYIFRYKPNCIIKWYGENVNYKHINLIPLPLGIPNYTGSCWDGVWDVNTFIKTRNQKVDKQDDFFACFRCETNPNHRNIIKSDILSQGINFYDNFNCKQYFEKINQYKYVISPNGHGIECHRTYEALYLGCIPIVEKHFMFDTWDLPIIQVDNYSDIRNKNILPQKQYNFDQLTVDYWIKKMKNDLF